jgi:ribonuclease P protein component
LKKNSLAHYERVKSHTWIEKIFSRDASPVYEDIISIRYLATTHIDYPLKAGFSVSKRLYKRAHDRNKYKRWLRETYRTNKSELFDFAKSNNISLVLFIIITKPVEDKTYREIELIIQTLLKKIIKKLSSNEPKVL